jgi:hypothetical protein
MDERKNKVSSYYTLKLHIQHLQNHRGRFRAPALEVVVSEYK